VIKNECYCSHDPHPINSIPLPPGASRGAHTARIFRNSGKRVTMHVLVGRAGHGAALRLLPEDANRAQHRIAITNRHLTSMGTKQGTSRGA